jgi:hypothetical protein
MNRLSRFATTVAASGSLALAGLGLSAGTRAGRPEHCHGDDLVPRSGTARPRYSMGHERVP